MKKLTVLAVAFAMVCMPSTMTAQKLSGLLKKAASSDVVNSVINSYVPGANSVSLPGSWTYIGAAVSLTGENVLSNVAGSAVTSEIEEKIDDYL